jgi:hypothetical protein
MPLLPTTLTDALTAIDDNGGPADTFAAAQKWSEAWWKYAAGMVYLNPGSLTASQQLATSAFQGVILAGFAPIPAPIAFFSVLDLAMRAGWASVSSPASLLTPVLSLTPAPLPFGPLGVTVVPVGLASPSKSPPRTLLATLIHTWTITIIAVGMSGPIGPIS